MAKKPAKQVATRKKVTRQPVKVATTRKTTKAAKPSQPAKASGDMKAALNKLRSEQVRMLELLTRRIDDLSPPKVPLADAIDDFKPVILKDTWTVAQVYDKPTTVKMADGTTAKTLGAMSAPITKGVWDSISFIDSLATDAASLHEQLAATFASVIKPVCVDMPPASIQHSDCELASALRRIGERLQASLAAMKMLVESADL